MGLKTKMCARRTRCEPSDQEVHFVSLKDVEENGKYCERNFSNLIS